MSCSFACRNSDQRTPRSSYTTTYPFIEFGDLDCNRIRLLVPLDLEQANLFFDDLAQEECEQFFVVTRLSEVLAEALRTTTSASQGPRVRI